MEGSTIPTSSSELNTDIDSTSDQSDMILPQTLCSRQTQQKYGNMVHQAVPKSSSTTDNSRRIFREPRARSKQIPFRKPPEYIAQLEKHDQHRKKPPLAVSVPPSTEMTVLGAKGGSPFKFSGTTTSEIIDLDSSQPASSECIHQVKSDAACQPVDGNIPISKYLSNETRFHFNDSLQVQPQDLPTASHPEHTQLVRDGPSIPITYDRVWDPFAPLSQPQEMPKDAAAVQAYPSPAPTTRSMSFSLPPNYTEPHIHHAPPSLSSSSVVPNDDPPIPAWKIASQSIVKAPKGPELARLEDCLSEDIAIRAVLNGWDSIGERWELPPFWRVIRVLDEVIFGKFNPVVRLASLRVVHLLMRYHSDPSPERAKNMPKFYNLKGLDFDDDYSIGNFLPWPGIRALAQNPLASFRSDKFFRLETTTLKILWPFSLQDCYTRDPSTGLFAISKGFDKRIYDINAWTFEPKMFEQFPEFGGCEEEEVEFDEW
ncbi:hypothetical protein N431DRAFT_558371 [Stipitochalara longipes BDJ]|nr:hypothetical protein N431DRAFT_558371 [Stipitochalara longipes BDJ]